jgi:tRNA-specific 2-thiouridylase
MSPTPEDVVVGLSGGVDSAVAAALLMEGGYRVTGLFMKNWEEDDDEKHCAAAVDLADANAVCDRLGIELRTVNFSHEYWERVFSEFLKQYESGLTPNPDVLCNREIKFSQFLDHARSLGASRIATGHYAGVEHAGRGVRLLRGRDGRKDQSYFLYALRGTQLASSLFPLHRLTKTEVRAKARALGLSVHEKKDSTGICFIGERRFKEFLARYIPPNPGEIVDPAGRLVGRHDGLNFHTIGQRQGLGIGGAGEPWYVVRKDIQSNRLHVAQGHDHPSLLSTWLSAAELSWISDEAPELPLACYAKTRYGQADQACTVEPAAEGAAIARFAEPQRAVTPGQAVVFYQGDVCLGGGTIRSCEALEPS